ncbi:hypothetical protein LTR56_001599 [Elasticomyces elasticus]|nr:hypothetical protein LTR56_001599 [Elasticomyces elasticus]KAK3667349.1 hypothetical protein LTR22_001865 [Elasticomyces elasticus]KAK4932571.1 hypothetical protein LTR49_000995 [Elasticomyces elasticus]KAK5769593.1 hypothetical protein LTS12_000043 [Elasticomyces elasticus]
MPRPIDISDYHITQTNTSRTFSSILRKPAKMSDAFTTPADPATYGPVLSQASRALSRIENIEELLGEGVSFTPPLQTFIVPGDDNSRTVTHSAETPGGVVNVKHAQLVFNHIIPSLAQEYGDSMINKVQVRATTEGQARAYQKMRESKIALGTKAARLPMVFTVHHAPRVGAVEVVVLDLVINRTADSMWSLKHGEMVCWTVVDGGFYSQNGEALMSSPAWV